MPERFCGLFVNFVPSPDATLLYEACFGVVCKCAKCIEMSEFDVADCRCVFFFTFSAMSFSQAFQAAAELAARIAAGEVTCLYGLEK